MCFPLKYSFVTFIVNKNIENALKRNIKRVFIIKDKMQKLIHMQWLCKVCVSTRSVGRGVSIDVASTEITFV